MTDVHFPLLIPSYPLNKCYKKRMPYFTPIQELCLTSPMKLCSTVGGMGPRSSRMGIFFSLVSQQISCQDIFFTFPCSKVQNRNKRCCLPVFDHSILGGSQKTVLLSFNLATQKQLHSKLQGFCYRDHKGMSISSLKHVFTNKSDY